MKSKFVLLALVLLVVTPLIADERQKLVQDLERTSAKFLKSVEGLSEAQWNYKPAPEKWSIAQCAEHIAASEALIRGFVEKALGEPLPEGAADLVQDEKVQKFIVDRSSKFKAPEPLVPTDRFGTPAAALETFRTERATTLKLAQGDAEFRKHAAKHPGFGMLDTYGWMLFLSGHTERHTLQIEEIKASDGFPKQAGS